MATRCRVLHVVGGNMRRGGTETWLVHVLRHIDRDRFQMDFLAHPSGSDGYDDEVRAMGSQLIECPSHRNPLAYARHFAWVMQEHGPYRFVHCHMHHWSGFVSFLAHRYGAAVRIAHSHNSTDGMAASFPPLARQAYMRGMKMCIKKYATHGLAASEQAAEALYGPRWREDNRWQVLYCGLDFRPFAEKPSRELVRSELGIPPDAKVIGHIGRFVRQKNHTFLVDVAAAVMRDPRVWLLLVGDGELRPEIERKVQTRGIADRVVFTGEHKDVPRLLQGAIDLVLFPSLHEGLGLALLEAQAAGVSCLISDVIPKEGEVIAALINRLSLDAPIAEWSTAAADILRNSNSTAHPTALKRMLNSPFDIGRSTKALQDFYERI